MEQAKHKLPQGDTAQDHQHQLKLDEETKLRRRVYELLLAHSCAGVDAVDGLEFDRRALHARDSVWERLVELGVVKKSRAAALTGS